MRRFSVDGVRLSDMSVIGWGLVLIAVIILTATAVHGLSTLILGGTGEDILEIMVGLGVTALALLGAVDHAAPEFEGACAHCGTTVRTQAHRDGVDEIVEVRSSGTPRRATIGPVSVVLETQTKTWTYCSGACAADDSGRRLLVERPDGRDLVSTPDASTVRPTATVTATDGGREQHDDQGIPQPASGDSER